MGENPSRVNGQMEMTNVLSTSYRALVPDIIYIHTFVTDLLHAAASADRRNGRISSYYISNTVESDLVSAVPDVSRPLTHAAITFDVVRNQRRVVLHGTNVTFTLNTSTYPFSQ
jgi:hypothetical protein